MSNCFLCTALEAPQSEDRENLVLIRRERAFVIMNRYPYSNGHLMVCPNRHLDDLRGLSPEEFTEIGLLTNRCLEVLQSALNCHGFNIGWNIGLIAGAGLEPHVHQHIVPRWKGDTNFISVLGETRVISQDLGECYDMLKNGFDSLSVNS